jgi:predicted transcriptional regulator
VVQVRAMGHLNTNVKLRVDDDIRRIYDELARENDRSAAAEMRRALRAYPEFKRLLGLRDETETAA